MLHEAWHSWSNLFLAPQICVSLFCILTQGYIQEKAKILQSVRVNDVRTTQLHEIIDTMMQWSCFVHKISDLTYCYLLLLQWFENEKERLGHLRDRASETGRRKEYPLDHFTRCDLPLLLTCLWCSSSLWLNYHFWILLFASSKINFGFVYNLLGNCVRVLLRTKLVEVSDTYWYPCVNL